MNKCDFSTYSDTPIFSLPFFINRAKITLKIFNFMAKIFEYDIFLSHSAKDRAIVCKLADRLKADGLRVWLDQWIISAGDPISLKIQHGIEKSRTLVMCMSPNFFESEWARIEHHSLFFRDPSNEQRRFIPLLITDCELPDIIAQFAYIDWRTEDDEKYRELLEACRVDPQNQTESANSNKQKRAQERVSPEVSTLKGHTGIVKSLIVNAFDDERIISGASNGTLRIWFADGTLAANCYGHADSVNALAFMPDGKRFISGDDSGHLKIWDTKSGGLLTTWKIEENSIECIAVMPDGKHCITYSSKSDNIRQGIYNTRGGVIVNMGLKLWNIKSQRLLSNINVGNINSNFILTPDGNYIVCGQSHGSIWFWEISSGKTFSHWIDTTSITSIVVTSDSETFILGCADGNVRIWEHKSERLLATLEVHTDEVKTVAITPDDKYVVSGSADGWLHVTELATGKCLEYFAENPGSINKIVITHKTNKIFYAADDMMLRTFNLPEFKIDVSTSKTKSYDNENDSTVYTNAKVALIGDSGVGKTGLAIRLVENRWEKTDSTHGMNIWQFSLVGLDMKDIACEIWLWDFAGQPDYRLIHQLYLDETALAVIVIDPQRDNPFEPLTHWERALSIAVKNKPAKLLVAGRCDRAGITVSQAKLEQYCLEHGYEEFLLNTSAKTGDGCLELKDAIARNIPWERLPWTSTSRLFKALKNAIIGIKQKDIVLIRFVELYQRLQMELPQEIIEEASLRKVVGLLDGQGLIKPLEFGDFILLRPEEINNYASVVVRTAREDSEEIGAVSERDVLSSNIHFPGDMKRLKPSDEEILLRAMIETFVNRSLCIREDTSRGTQLVFPSYFKQEREEVKDHPNMFITYGFKGVLDEIYSTLIVRLHYTSDFEKDQLWKYAADFKTLDGKRITLQMNKKAESKAEITVHLESGIDLNTQLSFIKYVHEHLLKKAKDVTRVRYYICPHCNNHLKDREVIKWRLENGYKDIVCGFCEKRVVLIDMIEERFASDKLRLTVQDMDIQAQINLDNESLELILVGHAFTIAGEAGQIFRPTPNSDWGIDGEIEFKNDRGEASGMRVYLQLKSGDSYLRLRQRDEKEVFTIKNPRWAQYWQAQRYPVMLVIRTSDGRIRWMNVTEYLRQQNEETKQIVFQGERFTAPNVAKMRDKLLL